MLVDDPNGFFLPTAVHLFALLAVLSLFAWRNRDGKRARLRWLLVGLLTWSYVFSTPAIANVFVASLESAYPPVSSVPPSDDALIVVLAGGLIFSRAPGGEVKLDASSWERAWAGIQLWKKIHGRLLFVGEPTPDGASSAAEHMAAVALESGVPASAVQVETRSRNTYENFAFIRPLVGNRSDGWLVTSAMHMRRALRVAHKAGINLRPFACDHRALALRHWYAWLPNSGGPEMFEAPLHEWVGLVYYRVRGFAD